MSNAGFPEVRQAIAEKVSREHQVTIDGNHVVMSVGAAGALNTVFKTICSPGDEVIVPRPYFMEYRAYTGNYGAKLVEVDCLDNFDLDIDAIRQALSEKTQAVLINSPNKFWNNTQLIDNAFVLLGPHIVSSHAKDLRWQTEMNVHFVECPLGEGVLDFATLLQRLSRLPNDVPLMIEHLASQTEYENGRDFLYKTAANSGVTLEWV